MVEQPTVGRVYFAVGAVLGGLLGLGVGILIYQDFPPVVFWLAGDLEWAFSPWTSALAAVGAVIVAMLIGRPLTGILLRRRRRWLRPET